MKHRIAVDLLGLVLSWWGTISAEADPLVTTGSTWKYFKGKTEASTPDTTAWRTLAFNDSAWTSGAAPFYYDTDTNPATAYTGNTRLSDMQNSYTSVFLRQKFVVTNLASLAALTLSAINDDGFIAWINGTQVASYNPPGAPITFTSVAPAAATEPPGYQDYALPDLAGYLKEGTNVLAVQVFNVSLGSSDFLFAAELVPTLKETTPPVIASVAPEPGVVTSLTQITVTFNEPVTGVDAADLFVFGLPATGISGSGAVYTFTFPQPPYETVSVSWSLASGITDVASPPNSFDPRGPAASWLYELVDPTSPTVAVLHPPDGLTVRKLTQVEVLFDRPVTGVNAADLLVNGVAAQSVAGLGAGPYVFQFPAAPTGVVRCVWAANHEITDLSPTLKPFFGIAFQYTVDPQAVVGDLVINEFMAENVSGLKDEESDQEDWIEIYNRGRTDVDLEGWSLTDEADEPGKWVFPAVTLPANRYVVVFASAKDRKPTSAGGKLHTNFKLGVNGEYLGLLNAESPRQAVSELAPEFPEQRNDVSYGRDAGGQWRYFSPPTPGTLNGASTITNVVAPVHFSVRRGFFNAPFNLGLATETPAATVRYTIDGSPPTETNGVVYTNPLTISASRIVRAVAFAPNLLPSRVVTHTYLFGLPANRRLLPALSLVTATNNLYGKTGIMEYNPRNTTKHGIAWERPVSAEFIRPEDNESFQIDCGLRVQGGGYIRERYNYRTTTPPEGKYSFRLYFRGDYSEGRLNYPWFPDTTVESFDTVVLRAGMNDPTNPFIRDEFARLLASDVGQPAAHGTFVNLFLNGVYKGYYNPCERIDIDFLRAYHGGGEKWDVIASFSELREGDLTAWNSLRNYVNANSPTNRPVYEEVMRRMDLTNFVEYLLPHIYGDTDDWPHNNWRAARERSPAGRFRFYLWDAEWSFGYNNPATHDTIAGQLSSLSPPWGGTEIQRLFTRLKPSAEFKLLFADRVHKHFYNDGAMTDAKIKARYEKLKGAVRGTISGFSDTIGTSWIPQRRRSLTNHFAKAGFLLSSNAPVFNQFGGRVPKGFSLTMGTLAPAGVIYFTTNGTDPRVMFTGAVSAEALTYQQPIQIEQGVLLKARTLVSTTNWSALSEATFQVAELGLPLRITELNYNPQGGDAYEFIELQNVSSTPLDLSGFALQGVDFRFSEGTSLAGGARLVLISPLNPALFAQRYPSVAVGGIFDGNLSNGGESLALVDRTGRKVVSLTYDDEGGWPIDADNGGRSLEIIDPDGDPNDPANWRASVQLGGSPGAANPAVALANVRLNEIFAGRSSIPGDGSPWPDFIELYNAGATTANVGNWSVSTDDDSKRFVLPAGTSIAPGGYLVIWCDGPSGAAGLHASFNLELHGGSVFLSDALANRVDALTYGLQLPSFSVGRIGGESLWQLTEPTPDGLNEIANVGAPAELAINEFLANAPPGQDDWIELHNMNVALPVSLQGLYVGTSNALQQLRSLSFVAPGGFARLFADEDVGPDHLDFKLPATGGAIVLADPVGAELSRVTYAAQKEGVTQGRLPDGTGSVVSFVNSASPGAPNYQISYTGPILNELMARNVAGVTDSAGRVADWVELYNPTAAEFDLSGMSLSVNESKPGQWVFPAGTTIAANDYLVLWCDGSRPASANLEATLNVGNSLAGDSGGVYLFTQAGQLADFVEYGFQIEDAALGRSGGSWSLLASATPDAANATPANLGALNNLRINEWMATSDGQDWLELFNADALPVSLAGVYLTDDPSISGLTNTAVAPLSFIAGAGWVKFAADGDLSKGRDHLRFSLDALGETVRVYGPTLGLIDSVDIGVQQAGVAQGRWPDGTATIVSFPTTPTPGAANYLPHPAIVISEVLTHTDPPFVEDAIEVFNRSEEAVDLSGWFLSNSQRDFKKYRVPAGTVIPARAFKVFYEADFNPLPGTPGSFTLNSAHGDEVHLSEADATGALTGYRASVEFGAAERDVSFGRYVTVLGEDFAPLERRTFGADELVSLEHFRTGTGLFNAYPKVGPVVINELMYHPATLVETNLVENEEEEFIELHNITDRPVELFDFTHRTNTWRLDKGVEFTFPQGETLAARGFLLVVNFDPLTNVTALAAFRKRYGVTAGVRLLGPYGGKLNNDGDRVELLRPDEPQAPPHPDAGFVPYLLVDCVNYTDQLPWPLEADEGSASLQRRIAEAYGNNAANWSARPPTPGRVNATPATTDADIDGQLDVWEILNGLNPNDAYDASVDLDHDGLTSAQEFVSGTDPLNPASYLHFEPPTVAGAKAVLRFTAAANKSYTVLFRDALDAGDWQRLGDVEAQAAPRMAEVPDTKPNLTGHRFYQLRTPRLP